MENLDKETIKNLTELCRIDCTEEEKETLLQDLKKILSFISQLDEVDTEKAVACSHVLSEMSNVLRDDIISEVMPRETFLKNAPSHTGGMIKVPPILK